MLSRQHKFYAERMADTSDALTPQELEAWSTWKRAADAVWNDVVRAITLETGLSGPDFSVLSRLVEEAGGSCRQQELADQLGWQLPRISRQLARMQQRGLLERTGDGGRITVSASEMGRAALRAARPVHAQAVRRVLLSSAPMGTDFWSVIGTLAAVGDASLNHR